MLSHITELFYRVRPMLTFDDENVDVLINVFSKPYQTALSLLTLLHHSGKHIDRIYFHEEPARSSFERTGHEKILRYLSEKIVYFQPKYWITNEETDVSRLAEEEYRLSVRYQYGLENSQKKYVLFIHNDIRVTSDVVSLFLKEIEGYSGVGQIGQCWWCPAAHNQLCHPGAYLDFRPDFPRLNELYTQGFHPRQRRAYHYGWGEQFRSRPWPLPECRLNEWCALVDRAKILPHTQPQGTAVPPGMQVPSGAKIGENFDEPVNLDTGVQWFRDLSHQGHRFKHVPIEAHVEHARQGRVALYDAEKYVTAEMSAKMALQRQFPEYMRS